MSEVARGRRSTTVLKRGRATLLAMCAVIVIITTLYGMIGLVISTLFLFFVAVGVGSKGMLTRTSCAIGALAAAWFCCVHARYSFIYCSTCRYCESQRIAVEILRIPMRSLTRASPSLISLVAEDLSCPCPHRETEKVDIYDRWGLLYSFQSTVPYTGMSPPEAPTPDEFEEAYKEFGGPIVRKFREKHPQRAEEFCQRAITEGDQEFGYQFIYDELHLPDF